MSKYHHIVILLCLVLIRSYSILAQDPVIEVRKSNDKVMIDGRTYYIHIVREGQTLYSISKVYQISQKEISIENPTVVFGLRTGQALKIPVEPEKKEDEGITEPDKYIYHKIEENQTIYSLSKRYGVEEEEILDVNPDLVVDDIEIGTTIKIPKKIFNPDRESFNNEGERFLYHRVGMNETLLSISKKYEVSIRQIRRANRDMKGSPEYGQYILIPGEGIEEPSGEPEMEDDLAFEEEPDTLDLSETFLNFNNRRRIEVALLLPFYLDENDERILIDSTEVDLSGNRNEKLIEREETWIYPHSFNYLEFYEGALLAIRTLQDKGVSVNLSVFDTERDSATVQRIVDGDSLRGMDLIIGPAFTHNLRIVAEQAREYRIPVVSPLASRNVLLEDNPYLFQVRPTFATEIEELSRFLSRYYDKNIVMIHPGDSLESNDISLLKRNLFYYLSYYTYFNEVVFKEVVYNEDITKNDSINSLEHALSEDVQNIVIVPSDKEPFVSSIVSNMNTLSQDYPITVFGYQSWERFRNIELDHFYNVNLHICTSFILDFEKENVKDFIRRFRNVYHTEPSQFSYAWQGYDIMYYFLSGVARYGKQFRRYFMRHEVDLLQSEYRFRRIDRNGGFENKLIHIVRYNKDFEISRVQTDDGLQGFYRYD